MSGQRLWGTSAQIIFRGWGDEQEFFWDGGMEEYTNILLITYGLGLITSGQRLWGTSVHFFSCLLSIFRGIGPVFRGIRPG